MFVFLSACLLALSLLNNLTYDMDVYDLDPIAEIALKV